MRFDEMAVKRWRARPSGHGLREPEQSEVGGKGRGILALPDEWTPRTLFLTHQVHRHVRGAKYSTSALEGTLPPDIDLEQAIRHLGSSVVIVRSDAAAETIAERGKFTSLTCGANERDVKTALVQIWRDADQADSKADVGVIVQDCLNRHAWGHISNEHRLNREVDAWTVELYIGPSVTTEQWRAPERLAARAEPLYCSSLSSLKLRLKSVAAHFSAFSLRHHLEWVWDGQRLWIVQADPVPPNMDSPPGELWRPRLGTAPHGSVTTWRELTGDAVVELSDWPKIRALHEFSESELDTYSIWCMSETEWLKDPEPAQSYLHDLEVLMSGHTVIRTDVAGVEARFMLPKTAAIIGPTEALAFMRDTLRTIRMEMPEARLAFLAHRFLRSRSSAWSYAVPDSSIVNVDSIWGLADGLGWLPHDKFSVDVRSGVVRRRIVAKTTFLDVESNSAWVYRDSPSDWIWRASLSDSQALDIARGSWRLARAAKSPRLTMWFAGLLDGQRERCLPWFQAGHQVGLSQSPGQVHEKTRIVIHDVSDLESWLGEAPQDNCVLVLRPNDSLLRDTDFVERLAKSGRISSALIEIDGSPLAHPYYLLRQAGATVVCPQSVPIQANFEKLVRDKIPDKIAAGGEFAEVQTVEGAALLDLVRRKLIEEAYEVAGAPDRAELIEELADLAEVTLSLLSLMQIDSDQVEYVRKQKLQSRGGFASGRFLQKTSSLAIPEDPQGLLPGLAGAAPRFEAPVEAVRGGLRIDLERLPISGHQEMAVDLEGLGISLRIDLYPREVLIRGDLIASGGASSGAAEQEPLFAGPPSG